MTFWQENYGFVKEVYDFRCSKYVEWMDNIEAIIGKVMAAHQYTYKEFKIIKDTFTSLCRDLDKDGTKAWLDMMIDKLSASHEGNEENMSIRDKAVKAQEKKKLEAMIERHHGLMGPTQEAQSKVQHYSDCYAFGDDIHPVMKVLNEQCHLSIKEIHPHNMDMVEEQIDKQEKVIKTIENQAPIYQELMKRGQKLKANPNSPAFLEKEMKRLEEAWLETNQKSKERLELLQNTHNDWEVYEAKRTQILTPLDSLEEQFKTYRKVYDPKKGSDWLDRKKKKADDLKKQIVEMYDILKKSFANIVALAGEDKREFMEKEVKEIDERKVILEKVDKSLAELSDFNERLTKAVSTMATLRAWMMPATDKLNFIVSTQDLSPEDRVKEIFDLQAEVNERLPLIEPLGTEIHELLDATVNAEGEEEGGQTSETALKHVAEYDTIKQTIKDLHEKVEMEAGSITQDQKYFADYLCGIKNFKPWMDDAESVTKATMEKPLSLEETSKLLETVKNFEAACLENKAKLDSAAESRSKMEKQTKADDEVHTLNTRWETVMKTASDRVAKVQQLCDSWSALQTITEKLALAITEIPAASTPDISSLEGVFKEFREFNEKKVELLKAIN